MRLARLSRREHLDLRHRDIEIQEYLAAFESKIDPAASPLPQPKDRHKPRRNEIRFDLRTELYRIFGVDLTQIPGVNTLTAHTLLAEVGPDLPDFPTRQRFPPG